MDFPVLFGTFQMKKEADDEKYRYVAMFAVVLCIAAGIAGCKKVTGGGWLSMTTGKATFGLQARCENIGYPVGQPIPALYVGHVTGLFQFKDRSSNVALHAVFDFIPFEEDETYTSCELIDLILAEDGNENTFLMAGTYTPIPQNAGNGGAIAVGVADGVEESGCGDGDFIAIQIIGGVYDGYDKAGCIEGGNITVFEE